MAIQYLNSSSIKAYPTDNRGKNESTDTMFNPESHYYSESNANKVGGTEIATRKSFAYETGDSLLIVIDGYRFDMSKSELISLVGSPALGDSLYAGIRVVEGDQTNHEFSQLAQVISNGAFGTILDYKASGDSDYRFYGLAFSKSQSELTSNGATSTLQVFACETAGTWKIPDASKIVLSTDRIAQYRNGDLDPTPISKEFDTGVMHADKADIAKSISSPTISGNTVVCNSAPSTQDKVITLAGFNYDDGATINVLFKNGNTASNPRLKINGETAIPICISVNSSSSGIVGVPAGTSPATSWSEGETVSLVLQSGSNSWLIVGGNRASLKSEVSDNSTDEMYIVGVTEDAALLKELKKNTKIMFKNGDMTLDSITAKEQISSPTITGNYATCSTAAATVDKAITLRGFVPAVGAVVNVKFTHKNTAVSPRLKVLTATGVYSYIDIMQNNGASVAGVDKYSSWDDGDVVSFVVINVPVTGNSTCVMTKPLNVLNALNDGDGNKIKSTYAHSIKNSVSDGVNTIDLLDMDGTVLDSASVDTVANVALSSSGDGTNTITITAGTGSATFVVDYVGHSDSLYTRKTTDDSAFNVMLTDLSDTGYAESYLCNGLLTFNPNSGSLYSQSGIKATTGGLSARNVFFKGDSYGGSDYGAVVAVDGTNDVGFIGIKISDCNWNGAKTPYIRGFTYSGSGGPTVRPICFNNIIPHGTTPSIGASSYPFSSIYATNFYGNTSLTNGTVSSQTKITTLKPSTTIEFENVKLTVGKRYMVEFSIETELGNDDIVGDSLSFPILYFYDPNGKGAGGPGTNGDHKSKVSILINASDLEAPKVWSEAVYGYWLITFIPGTGSSSSKSKIKIESIETGAGGSSVNCELTLSAQEVK